jgi:hypothetical protein
MPKYVSSFLIGLFATICAVFVPSMVAMLNGGHGDLQYFHRDFILVGIAFALVIGGITVIFEQSKQKSAGEIFMTALGIPALLAGALNSGTTGNNFSDLQSVNQKLNASLAQKSGISIEEKTTNITPLEAIPTNTRSPISKSGFSLISDAQARENEDATHKNVGLNFGIQVEQQSYLIVLDKLSSKEEAIQKAGALRKTIPKAMAVQSGQNFLVIDGEEPLSKSGALLKAIELQNKTRLKPYLLQAK